KDGKPASEPLVYDFDVASAKFSPDSRFLVLVGRAAHRLLWVEPSAPGMSPRTAQVDQPIREIWFDAVGTRVLAAVWDADHGKTKLQARSFDLITAKELAKIDEPDFSAGTAEHPLADFLANPDRERGTVRLWVLGAVVGERRMRFWD